MTSRFRVVSINLAPLPLVGVERPARQEVKRRARPATTGDFPIEGKGNAENGLAHDVRLGQGKAKRCTSGHPPLRKPARKSWRPGSVMSTKDGVSRLQRYRSFEL